MQNNLKLNQTINQWGKKKKEAKVGFYISQCKAE